MTDFLILPLILMVVGMIALILWKLLILDSGVFFIGLACAILLQRSTDSIFSLQNLNFTQEA